MMCLIVILIQNSMGVKTYFTAFFNKVQKKGGDYYKPFFLLNYALENNFKGQKLPFG